VSITVVPTKATAVLAAAMIATARREGSGAEAVILHYDDCYPDQVAALIGCLLDAATGRVINTPPRPESPTHCRDCGDEHEGPSRRGLCPRCYWRHQNAGTLAQFPRSAIGRKPGRRRKARAA